MPSLSDLKTQSLLESLLREVRELKEQVRRLKPPTNYEPPNIGTPVLSRLDTCPVCGIRYDQMTGYVCASSQCPTAVSCSSAYQGTISMNGTPE